MTNAALALVDVTKTFTMHLQGGAQLPAVAGVTFDVCFGECVVLHGPSGAGKSSILKIIYGNYRCDIGRARKTHRSYPAHHIERFRFRWREE